MDQNRSLYGFENAKEFPPNLLFILGSVRPQAVLNGRFAVSDVVTRGEILPEIRKSVLLWVGCVAGALDESEYRRKLRVAGFEKIDIEPTRIYRAADAKEFLATEGIDADALSQQVDGRFMSAFIRAEKPKYSEGCCESGCCG